MISGNEILMHSLSCYEVFSLLITMIIVRIFTNYDPDPPPKYIMEVWEKAAQYPGYGKKIRFTERDDYTHAIIVNTAMPVLSVRVGYTL